jgi:hypothetical protein
MPSQALGDGRLWRPGRIAREPKGKVALGRERSRGLTWGQDQNSTALVSSDPSSLPTASVLEANRLLRDCHSSLFSLCIVNCCIVSLGDRLESVERLMPSVSETVAHQNSSILRKQITSRTSEWGSGIIDGRAYCSGGFARV